MISQQDSLRTRRWSEQDRAWRDPAQITSQWQDARDTDPALLRHRARGAWWETLAAHDLTLLVTREYEHLVMALSTEKGRPAASFMRLPHPSGLAVDSERGLVHCASTRNPNQVYDLAPVAGLHPRGDRRPRPVEGRPLVPRRTRFYPGCLYMHDLALISGVLHANSVGQNAVVRLGDDGSHCRVWWPSSIEGPAGPDFGRNYLQLNSIAAGRDLATSYFSASACRPSSRRPGHRNFPVDRRGVIFSGATREPVAGGLTRPHSARLHAGRLWVDNSGYGELGVIEAGQFVPQARLPGWTRGLGFHGKLAFVGTSRVIPRFRQYAPGLDVDRSVCGVHAVDTESGKILGSLLWPAGNQIFAVEAVSRQITTGFPFRTDRRATDREKDLFYAFTLDFTKGG